MKYHIKLKGKPLCGRKRVKNKLQFVPDDTEFDKLLDKEQCQACRRVQER